LKVKFLRPSQINQFLGAYDVAAVQPSVGDMPSIVFAAMQSDRQSLLLKLRQSSTEF
jgi:hypothetical protein